MKELNLNEFLDLLWNQLKKDHCASGIDAKVVIQLRKEDLKVSLKKLL